MVPFKRIHRGLLFRHEAPLSGQVNSASGLGARPRVTFQPIRLARLLHDVGIGQFHRHAGKVAVSIERVDGTVPRYVWQKGTLVIATGSEFAEEIGWPQGFFTNESKIA